MNTRKGIVLAGGSGTRLYPLTIAISKQIMPVYDKPMIYYPISVLMLAGIREMLIVSTPEDLPLFKKLLGSGSKFGVNFCYAEQPSPDGLAQAFTIASEVGFLNNEAAALILGDNLFYGQNLTSALKRAMQREQGATIFGYQVADPSRYGVIEFDSAGKVISIEEKPEHPKSNFAIPGLYFYDSKVATYARQLTPSTRGELEITDLNLRYMNENKLSSEILGRGTTWLDTGTHESLLEAGEFVRLVEKRQGLKIACLEEIAYNYDWISRNHFTSQMRDLGNSSYGKYMLEVISDEY